MTHTSVRLSSLTTSELLRTIGYLLGFLSVYGLLQRDIRDRRSRVTIILISVSCVIRRLVSSYGLSMIWVRHAYVTTALLWGLYRISWVHARVYVLLVIDWRLLVRRV